MAKKMNRVKAALAGALFAVSALAVPATLPEQMADFAARDAVLTASAADYDNYAKLLQYSMYFYDANMCGNAVGEMTGLDWRDDCHTADDVDGGFHDAGDHAIFGQPLGYSFSTLGWSFYEFKDAYEATGQTAHLQMLTDYACRYFRDSAELNDSGEVVRFCYQKANGDEDHAYWGPPEKQGNTRKQYWTENSASDIAAAYAAALALNYINFGNEEDLKYAEALYAVSTKYNKIETDGPTGFYASKSCEDEQAWAAGWLYLATNNESYKNDCASKQASPGWVHGWENNTLGAACVYAHITGDWSKVNSYLSSKCKNPDSYYFLDKWGSARLNASMQMTALVASKNSDADYTEWCKGQMNYLLGNNPANTCFVIGYADNSARNAHHRAASGYMGWSAFNSATEISPTDGKVLVGALVGGPSDASGTYEDSIQDYVCNEVACDYNAGLVGAAAGLYSFFKTGEVETSIPGVTKIYDKNSVAPDPEDTLPTETEPEIEEGQGKYTLEVNEKYTYANMEEKMIGWEWASFGIPEGERPYKVEVNISKNSVAASCVGTWQGAFGSSTSVEEDGYWTQGSDQEVYIGDPSGTVTWEIDEATREIIQLEFGGELK
ncbi:MAG: glycoside hydrolase family 9 protein, partial [Oscillospiraceae bacterium]|nr:glycoside hydrolase family 9 protein [Oscillospiraceae bacterium]